MKVTAQQKQSVDIHRKLLLRKELLGKAGELAGAFYVPFIGDGDIAVELSDFFGQFKMMSQDGKERETDAATIETLLRIICDSNPDVV